MREGRVDRGRGGGWGGGGSGCGCKKMMRCKDGVCGVCACVGGCVSAYRMCVWGRGEWGRGRGDARGRACVCV